MDKKSLMKPKARYGLAAFCIGFLASANAHPPKCHGCEVKVVKPPMEKPLKTSNG